MSTAAPSPPRLLVADDHIMTRMLVEIVFEGLGFVCDQAEDGAEALAAATRTSYDLILMDIHMPGMGGVAATAAIRALPAPAGCTPILAITGAATRDQTQSYLAAGMQGVVEKPFTPAGLTAAAQAVMTEAQAKAQAAA